jgi:carboxypeptidase family protein/photosynthesis system II assembly factor YCF48-like protein/putative zinc finger protein
VEEKDGFPPAQLAVTRIMPELPNIVRERLRTQVSVPGLHPDPDVLSALAEQALMPAEREKVLEHLAVCEDCRATLVLALPPMESEGVRQAAAATETAAVSRSSKRSWFSRPVFAWPTLRWGALAAGAIVAGALLLHHTGNPNPGTAARQAAPEATSQPAATPPPASLKSESGPSNSVSAELDKGLADQKAEDRTKKLDALVAQNRPVVKAKDAEAKSGSFANKQLPATATPAADDMVAGLVGGKPGAVPSPSRETVEVNGATGGVVQTENRGISNQVTSSSSGQLPLSARNETTLSGLSGGAPPITRAKPATAAEQTAPMQMAKAAPRTAAVAGRFDSSQTTQFAGIVTDSSGAVVPNAKVTVTNRGSGLSVSTTTDQSGVYSLKELPVGTYQLMAEASGFQSVRDSNVPLSPGVTAHNFKLQMGQTSETVEVTGALAAVQTETMKARSSLASAKWSLSAGMLRRSFDGGATWRTSLPDGRLLCYAPRGNEIWAGGKSGLLFHSSDNGASWTQVHPSIGDRALADDVTHIEFRNATEIALGTSSGKTWTSSDGGKSWTAH